MTDYERIIENGNFIIEDSDDLEGYKSLFYGTVNGEGVTYIFDGDDLIFTEWDKDSEMFQ